MSDTIFVLCTGRCGSVTFATACRHATNYSVGHESLALRRGLVYPDRHIEVNNRLVWYLGTLRRRYPRARYVHLTRDPGKVASSYAQRLGRPFQIMTAWRQAVRMGWHVRQRRDTERPVRDDCLEYVQAVTDLIEMFLGTVPPSRRMHVRIERPETFRRFWDWAGLAGDRDAAVATVTRRLNPSPRPKPPRIAEPR